jgi:hypothetical protein
MAALISTILKAQADAQLAQTNANHANLIAFQTATAQALAAKGGDVTISTHGYVQLVT